MLNERLEVEELLQGKRFDKKYAYRSYYLLAKYYKEELQTDDILSIREKIFEWANKYNIYVNENLNYIIKRVISDKNKLTDNIIIYINDNDINEIKRRFDKYNVRLLAFALLCYAKVYADKDNMFRISQIGLSNWINISHTNIAKYIQELIDLKYIKRVEIKSYHKYKNRPLSKMNKYQILVDIKNEGDIFFKDIDFKNEFKIIFGYL